MSLVEVQLPIPFIRKRGPDAARRKPSFLARGVVIALRCDTVPSDSSKCSHRPPDPPVFFLAPPHFVGLSCELRWRPLIRASCAFTDADCLVSVVLQICNALT